MQQDYFRKIVYYKRYYLNFLNGQTEAVRLKFNWTLQLIATLERDPEKHFKHVYDGIYEVRVEVRSNTFRVFCFFDEGKLVVLVNGFQKKTQKTPASEIALATKIRKEYLDEKHSK